MLAVTAALAVIIHISFNFYWALPVWLIFVVLLAVFRDFPRTTPSVPLAVVSPVDGQVVDIGLMTDPVLQRDALKISIRQNLLGEYNIHSPIEGQVQVKSHSQVADADFAIQLTTDEQDDVVVVVDRTSPIRFKHFAIHSGERVGQGRRCGFIGFGRMVDLYLPAASRSEVQTQQLVKAGSDIIGTLVHEET